MFRGARSSALLPVLACCGCFLLALDFAALLTEGDGVEVLHTLVVNYLLCLLHPAAHFSDISENLFIARFDAIFVNIHCDVENALECFVNVFCHGIG